jgi:phage gpG-like protein
MTFASATGDIEMSMEIRVDPAQFNSRKLRYALTWFDKLDKHLEKIGAKVLDEVRRNVSGRILHKRTGTLWDSWGFRMETSGDVHSVIIGSPCVYSRIHDMGGWTGRGHKTKIPKSSYARKALVAKKTLIRKEIKDFMARATLG